MAKKPIALIIMDGYGINQNTEGNAIVAAKKPHLDKLLAEYPHSQLSASGLDVGLPDGQMGNSEVGHTNIGAGRIVYQMLVKISKDINDGKIYENKALSDAMDAAKANGKSLHLMGLLSNSGVHSHNEHLYGLLKMAKKKGIENVYVHTFLDGRDVPPTSGAEFMAELEKEIKEIGVGSVATIMGRFYAMDRDNAWDRVEKAYKAMVDGEGIQETDAVTAVKNSYANDITDEFVIPTVVDKNGMIKEGDSVIFFNFRPDRARQITRTFVDPDFTGFERKYFPVNFVCMTQYDESMPNVTVAYPPETLEMTFGEYISKKGLTQLRIAETEKYAHVTYFFDGGVELNLEGCQRILIPSPKVATYDLKPEMSAFTITETLLKELDKDYDFIVLNFANGDMVGHTGNLKATIKAMEAIDECLGKIYDKIKEKNGVLLITDDHGNSDEMLDFEGRILTAHSLNKVPFIITNKNLKLKNGKLANIAPTILELLNLPKPKEMTEESLIER